MKILSNQNFFQNESSQLTLEHLSLAPQNPKMGQMYYNTAYKKGYICVKEATLKNIEVGDNLKRKTIFFKFPNKYIPTGTDNFITVQSGESFSNVGYDSTKGYITWKDTYAVYVAEDGKTKEAFQSLSLNVSEYRPENGVVSSIDNTNASYSYFYVVDEDATWREIGGSGDTLPIGAIVDYDGTTVPNGYEQISSGKTPVETVLYNANGSPTAGSVTLSDSISKYDELCISGWSNANALFNVNVPTNKTQFRIAVVDNNSSGTNAWLKQTTYNLEDKKITMLSAFWREINSTQQGTDDSIRINKVVGIKKY
nr:MAG TPA: hypothetical protein [Caudoviricetes sp.]